MAVVYPLMPVDNGASEVGAPNAMELHFIMPSDTFRSLWPENTLRRLFVNVDDAHLEQTQEWLDEYTENVDSSLPVTIELIKFKIPTRAIMILMAFPITAEERVSFSYCSAMVCLDVTGRLLSTFSVYSSNHS